MAKQKDTQPAGATTPAASATPPVTPAPVAPVTPAVVVPAAPAVPPTVAPPVVAPVDVPPAAPPEEQTQPDPPAVEAEPPNVTHYLVSLPCLSELMIEADSPAEAYEKFKVSKNITGSIHAPTIKPIFPE